MDKTLAGVRVLVTRPADQSTGLVAGLRARGALAAVFPLIGILPLVDFGALDRELLALGAYDWVLFTSQNAVRHTLERARHLRISYADFPKGPKIGVVGPATGKTVASAGLAVAHASKGQRGAALVEELGPELTGKNVFLPRSDIASREVPEALARLGARVTEVAAYRTVSLAGDGGELERQLGEPPNAAVFFSPSAVRAFLGSGGQRIAERTGARIVAIGPVTRGELETCGVPDVVEARDTTDEAVLGALEAIFSKSQPAHQKVAQG